MFPRLGICLENPYSGEFKMDKFTVRGTDGSVDVAASANAYALALTKWVAENEIASDTIELAVEAAFDRHPGRLPMPALLGAAVNELGASPAQFKSLTERVHAYVKGQATTGRLEIGRGKGGGVIRLALPGQPIPAKPAKSA
jgi:hypothetical protein